MNRDKIIAKIVFNVGMAITSLAIILLIASIETMVESAQFTGIMPIIAVSCIAWLALVTIIMHWLKK